MIRRMTTADLSTLHILEGDYMWELGDDFFDAWVAEEEGRIVAIVGFWKRAEAHMVVDHSWRTPQERLVVLEKLHQSVKPELAAEGISEVWTFMDDMRGFGNRLKELGWQVIERMVYGRRVD